MKAAQKTGKRLTWLGSKDPSVIRASAAKLAPALPELGDPLLPVGLASVGGVRHPDAAVRERRAEAALELEERQVDVAVGGDRRERLLHEAAGDRLVQDVAAAELVLGARLSGRVPATVGDPDGAL